MRFLIFFTFLFSHIFSQESNFGTDIDIFDVQFSEVQVVHSEAAGGVLSLAFSQLASFIGKKVSPGAVFFLLESAYLLSSGCTDSECLINEGSRITSTVINTLAYKAGFEAGSKVALISTGYGKKMVIFHAGVALVFGVLPYIFDFESQISSAVSGVAVAAVTNLITKVNLSAINLSASRFSNVISSSSNVMNWILFNLKRPLFAGIASAGGVFALFSNFDPLRLIEMLKDAFLKEFAYNV